MAYDRDTDYQAIIDKAIANGDYKAAAQAEKSRNEKIADLNASGTNIYGASATNKYSGWLDDTDYGDIGKQQMASGARPEEVLKTYTNRLNKASGTEGLSQYANDDLQQSMLDYILNYEEKPASGGFSFSSAPTYKDSYSDRIDAMLDDILNRDKFTYDPMSDPLYAQYKQQYNQEGDRAMRDTLGAVSAKTGGLASSYATTAAQQANQEYARQLANKVPELYQLAYQMYLDDIDLRVQDLGLLNNASNTAYNRYRDTMSDWRNDRDFAYGAYRDDAADRKWQTEFDYGVGRDQIADDRYEQEWNYNTGRDQIADERYDRDWQYGLDRDKLEDDRYEREWALQQQNAAKKRSGSGGGGSSGGNASGDVYQWLAESGATDYGTAYNMLRNAGYSTTDANRYAEYFDENAETYLETEHGIDTGMSGGGSTEGIKLSTKAQNIFNGLKTMTGQMSASKGIPKTIQGYVKAGTITANEGAYMLDRLGFDPDDYLQ